MDCERNHLGSEHKIRNSSRCLRHYLVNNRPQAGKSRNIVAYFFQSTISVQPISHQCEVLISSLKTRGETPSHGFRTSVILQKEINPIQISGRWKLRRMDFISCIALQYLPGRSRVWPCLFTMFWKMRTTIVQRNKKRWHHLMTKQQFVISNVVLAMQQQVLSRTWKIVLISSTSKPWNTSSMDKPNFCLQHEVSGGKHYRQIQR